MLTSPINLADSRLASTSFQLMPTISTAASVRLCSSNTINDHSKVHAHAIAHPQPHYFFYIFMSQFKADGHL